jgi:C_GCAxxG_C_C family probable redox protein
MEQSMDHQEEKGSEKSIDLRVERFMEMYGTCSQASFSTLQEKFALECDTPSFVKALRPFPGVGHTFETCGAVTGCLIALGLVYGTVDRTDKDKSRNCMLHAKDFCSKVAQELGSTRCGEIMERQFGRRFDLDDPSQREAFREAGAREKCTAVVKTAVRIASKLIQQSPEHDAG